MNALTSRSSYHRPLYRHLLPKPTRRLSAHYLSSATRPPRDPKQLKADQDYCIDLVQTQDSEGYVCGLLLPVHARKPYFAVRAFNAELASIKDGERVARRTVSSSAAVKVRLQWWRNVLDRIYEKEPAGEEDTEAATLAASYFLSPVVRTLDAAIEEKELTRRFLERLIDAREEDLERTQMARVEDLIMFAEDTVSAPLYLSLECAGVREDTADLAAFHAGIGIGIVSAIRSFRYRAAFGEITIPQELLPSDMYPALYLEQRSSGANDSETIKLVNEYDKSLRDAVQTLSVMATGHLNAAREMQFKVPKHARPCFLLVIPSIHYLSKLERAKYDVWDPLLLDPSRFAVLLRMARTWLTGVF